MAALTIYYLNTAATTPNWFGRVQDNGSAPAGALSAYGWNVAKVALTTPYWRGRFGATARSAAAQAASWIDAQTGPVKGTGSAATTAGDSFTSDGPLTGTWAAGNWNFTFGMRTGAASHAGRVRLRVWASANADGTSARELTTATQVGSTITLAATGTTYNSTITWAAPQIVLNNEYVFTQIEWQVTTVGTSNSCTAQFYQCSFVTTNWDYKLVAANLAVSIPVLDAPAFSAIVTFSAAPNLAVGIPVFGAPVQTVISNFTAINLEVTAPVFGEPAFNQSQVFSVTDLAVDVPTLGTPTLSEVADEATGTGALVAASATRTNLATHSQNILSATSWFAGAASTTSNSTTAPDGTLTAETLTDNNSNATHQFIQLSVPTEVGKTYTFSLYVKAGTLSWVQLQSVSDSVFGNFDVTNGSPGALGQKSAGATTKIDAVLTASFYRCSLTFTATQTSTAAAIVTLTGDNIDPTYTGTFQTLYVWGAQFEEGSTATTYIPTTTATVTVPSVIDGYGIRRAAQPTGTGALQAVQQPSRINQILQSQTIDHSSWVPFGATVATNFQSPSDAAADKITDTTASTQHCVYQDRSATQVMPAGAYTMSAYVRRDVLGAAIHWFVLGADASSYSHRAAFNINTGVVGSKDLAVASHAIQSIGNGWYRCSITFTTPIKPEYIYLFLSNADTTNPSYTGTGTGAMYVWGVQLEPGEVATEYIPTTTAPVTVLLPAMGSGLAHNVGEPVTTWDPAFKSSAIELSDGNRTATANWSVAIDNVDLSVRGTTKHGGTDKVYFEIVINKENDTLNVGLTTASSTIPSYPGMDDDNGFMVDIRSGYVIYNNWSNEYYFTALPDFVTGDVLGYSCDFGARKVYFTLNGVSLKGDAVAGTDGCPMRGGTADMYPWLTTMCRPGAPRSSVLLRTTNLAYAPPTGYSEWDAPSGAITAASLAVGSPVVGGGGATRTNLLLHSQALDTSSTWLLQATSVAADTTTAPDSTLTAETFTATATTAAHGPFQQDFPITVGQVYTASIHAKVGNGTLPFIQLRTLFGGASEWANFNLTTGTLGTKTAGSVSAIQSLGDGWYRCSITTPAATITYGTVVVYQINADSSPSCPGGLGTTHLWGAQVEQSSEVTDYIPTTTAAVTTGGFPTLIQIGPVSLSATSLQIAAVVLGTPALNAETYVLTATSLQAGTPVLGAPALTETAPSTGTTLDPAKTSAKLTLSSDKLTVTYTTSTGWGQSLSELSNVGVSSRFYAEVVCDTVTAGNFFIGVIATTAFADTYIGDSSQSVGLHTNGQLWRGHVAIDANLAIASGDRIAVALDGITVAFRNITKGGSWSGAYNLNSVTEGTALRFGFSGQAVGEQATFVFNKASFVGKPPDVVGYTTWNGEALTEFPATLDPGRKGVGYSLSGGDLIATKNQAGYYAALSHGHSGSTKIYAEAIKGVETGTGNDGFGITNNKYYGGFVGAWLGGDVNSIAYYSDGSIYKNGSPTAGEYAATPIGNHQRIAIAVDTVAQTVSFRNITTSAAWSTPYNYPAVFTSPLHFGVSQSSAAGSGKFFFDLVVGDVPAGYTNWNGDAFTQFNLLISYAPSERGAFDGWVGTTFTATKNMVVKKLGLRRGTDSNGSHTAYLYEVSGTTFVGGVKRSVAINMTGGIVGVYYYGDISPFTIETGKSYFLSSLVTSGDPQLWGDNAAGKLGAGVTGVQAAYTYDEALLNRTGTDNQFYGVDLVWEEATAAGTDSLTATSLAVAAPTIGTPQLTIVLIASNLAAPSPVIGLPTFGRVLSGANLATGPPALAAAPFTQVHALTAVPAVAGVPAFGAAVLGQSGVMAAIPIAVVAPTIGAPVFTQPHTLAAVALSVPIPSIGQGVYGRVITATPCIVVSPTIGSTTLTKVLTAANAAAGVPVLGTPALGKVLAAANLAVTPPTVGGTTISQNNVLAAASFAVVPPSHTAVVMGQAGVMAAMPITVVPPTIGAGTFTQRHTLVADPLPVTAPTIGQGVYGRVITATPIAVTPPTIGSSSITKVLSAVNAAAGALTLGTPALGKVVSATGLAVTPPTAAAATFSQTHTLTGIGIAVVAPSHSAAVMSQAGIMAAIPVVSGQPVFGTAVLTQRHVLVPLSFATGLPATGTAAITQSHTLVPVSPVAIPPAISSSSIGQKHAITAVTTAAGAFVHSAVVLGQAGIMAAIPIAVVSPTIGVALFGQAHRVIAQPAAAGSPLFSLPLLGKVLLPSTLAVSAPVFSAPQMTVVLAAASSLATSPPVLGTPAFKGVAVLIPAIVTTSPPVLGTPAFKQRHTLTAIGKTVAAINLPDLTLGITGIMSAVPAKAGAPVIGQPAIALLSIDCTAINLSVGTPVLAQPAMVVRVLLTASNVAAGVPATAVPALAQRHALVATRVPVSPVVGTTQIQQEHRIAADALVAGDPVLRAGFFGQAGIMAALPLWVASPILPTLAPRQRHKLTGIATLSPAPELTVPDMGVRTALPRAQSTFAGRFKGPAAVLGQVHHFSAPAVTVAPPQTLQGVLTPRSDLAAIGLSGVSPALGAPLMGVRVKLIPKGMRYEYPVLGAPQLGQEHALVPSDLEVSGPLFSGIGVAEHRVLPDPFGFEVAAPVLGMPVLVHKARLYQMADLVGRRPKTTIVGQRDSQVTIVGRSKRRVKI